MTNIERLANFITKNGSENIMIHTVPGTKNWIICQKIEKDKWLLTLTQPMGNITYNLGIVSNRQHLQLWTELIKNEIEIKTSQIKLAKELKEKIYKFTKKYEQIYKKFIKIEKTTKRNKNNRILTKRRRSKKYSKKRLHKNG